jgi:hypothetical protein
VGWTGIFREPDLADITVGGRGSGVVKSGGRAGRDGRASAMRGSGAASDAGDGLMDDDDDLPNQKS